MFGKSASRSWRREGGIREALKRWVAMRTCRNLGDSVSTGAMAPRTMMSDRFQSNEGVEKMARESEHEALKLN